MIDRQRLIVFPLAARTAAPTTVTVDGRRVRGIIAYLNITARGAAAGGLTVTLSGKNAEGNKVTFFAAASPAAAASGNFVYVLSPDDMAAGGGVTEVAKRPVPFEFTVDVTHADATSYTYSLTIETY
jgi:hypothetical protein